MLNVGTPLLKRPLLLLTALLFVGCQSAPPLDNELAVEKEIDAIQSEVQQTRSQALPDAVDKLLLPGLDLSDETADVAEERFDISVQNVSARDFFLGLVEGTDVSLVMHPDVRGTISLELSDVSIEDVLNVVRDIYGYEYKSRKGIYTIYPRELRTEIFSVDYLNVSRIGSTDTSILIGEIRGDDSDSSSGNNSSNGSGSDSGLIGALLASEAISGDSLGEDGDPSSLVGGDLSSNPGARVQTLTKTDFWTGLQRTISAMVDTGKGDRLVVINPQAGLVVVKALPEELNTVREFLEKSQLSVQRQVILEAKILEVVLNEEYNTGINWDTITGQLNLNWTDTYTDTGFFHSPTSQAGTLTTVLGSNDLTQLIDLLNQRGQVQVLSSPRISTVNNQKAVIKVGTNEFFVTDVGSTTTNLSSGSATSPDVELTSFFSGIALDVTPQIAENGDIIIHVHPVISNITDQQKDLTVGDSVFSLPLAFREIRETDTIVRARSGQVVILGGLMQEKSDNTDFDRPGLAKIPGLGRLLFKGANREKVKSELVILLRPIIADDDQWGDYLKKSQSAFKKLGNEYRERNGLNDK